MMNMYMGTVPLADAGKQTRHPSDITVTATLHDVPVSTTAFYGDR